MKMMKKLKNFVSSKVTKAKQRTLSAFQQLSMLKAAFITFLMSLTSAVMAEVPAEVKTSLATAKTDSLEVAGIVLGIIVAIFAFMLMRRVLK